MKLSFVGIKITTTATICTCGRRISAGTGTIIWARRDRAINWIRTIGVIVIIFAAVFVIFAFFSLIVSLLLAISSG